MFDRDGVSVDEHFARFGTKSFAIDKITSVEVRSDVSPGSKAYYVWWALALWVSPGAILAPHLYIWVWALLFFALGLRSWMRRKSIETHRLFLVTAGGEAQAFATQDPFDISDLRNAIEGAMIRPA